MQKQYVENLYQPIFSYKSSKLFCKSWIEISPSAEQWQVACKMGNIWDRE